MHAQTHAPQLRGVPRGQASRSGDFCGCHNLGVLWWVEARDAAQHPTMHRAVVPHLCCKELSAQKVHSAEDKNPWFRSKKQFSLWGGKAAPGSGLTRAAGLEASRCSHHPLGTSGGGGGWLCDGRAHSPPRSSPRAGPDLSPRTSSAPKRKACYRCHYGSLGSQAPGCGQDRPSGQGFLVPVRAIGPEIQPHSGQASATG